MVTSRRTPAGTISFRLEYRHDAAASNRYYRGWVPSSNLPNTGQGNTTTVGATAWFRRASLLIAVADLQIEQDRPNVKVWTPIAAALLQLSCSSDEPSERVDASTPDSSTSDAGLTHLDASPGGDAATDFAVNCWPCVGYWTCGNSRPDDAGTGGGVIVDLKPEPDGCYLSGLSGRNLLAPDGTITENGVLLGTAEGSGARVHVTFPDGGLWLYCAAGGGCGPSR
ncbi:MAG: hypothetical protein JWN04_3574 [Myxococcaceae bacterium]|nr:hypothetical protein [Myxococcaceae bacterium]